MAAINIEDLIVFRPAQNVDSKPTPQLMPNSYIPYLLRAKSGYNGCGPDGLASIVPDSIMGLPISGVCDIHDHMCERCANELDEIIADAVFAFNLVTRIVSGSNAVMVWPRMAMAVRYITAVSCTTFTKSYWPKNSAICPNGRYCR
jgi:hypothetical protein